MIDINFKKIEKKWQKKWGDANVFVADEKSKKSNYYVLEMFPYPSGSGLHMGHAWNYVIGDILARFKLMKGFNVLHPMGYDSLGLPAENAAIEDGTNPQDYTEKAIKNYVKQQKALGLSYDWTRMVKTSSPDFYKWDQWIFLKMLEKGLAYQKESNVNWCSKCNTVLANEQVHDGKCWRHEDTEVDIKNLKQWFLKTTEYADELYEGINDLKDWPEKTKAMQKHWIGKSYGTEIDFSVEGKVGNVVMVHGCPNGIEPRSDEERAKEKHWRLWIKEKLEERNVLVDIPLMPEPWKQDYKKWKEKFDKLNIDENSILIGQSCGAAFLVRWLGDTRKKIKKLILVAPWKIPHKENGGDKEFYEYKINKCVKSNVGEILIFTSDDEVEDGKKSVKLFEKDIGGKIIELKNHGHYTFNKMRTYEFPELLDEIIKSKKWPIFTTRPDTIFGVTFMVVSAQHSKLMDLVTKEQKKKVEKFLEKIKSVSEKNIADMEKEGVFTGSYATNPMNGEKVPIYAGNFVVADYGSGMVMAVPAHDQRDFEFAKKYGIELKQVVEGKLEGGRAHTGNGKLINSQEFDGLESDKAKEKITKFLEKKKAGRKVVQFGLRDWGISRQRYWGTPIPIIHCEKCGAVPVPEKDLPIKLPKEVKFGKGNPLETNDKWKNVKCPKCNGKGVRETDTMDTFVNSSWYFLRYCDSNNSKEIFDRKKVEKWCPVDSYIGGAEHACMHLIYSRFYTKFLRDIGLIKFDEPFRRLLHQGLINGEDGEKMSKSKGNVVNPLEKIQEYGSDTLRFFMVSMAAPDKGFDWNEKGVVGSLRFVNKIFEFESFDKKDSPELEVKLNNVVKNVSEYYDNFNYRKATIEIRELFDLIEKGCSKKSFGVFLKLLNPICPHITEELWEKIGGKGFISNSSWPEFDSKKLKVKKKEVDLNSKVVDLIKGHLEGKKVSKIYLYVVPFEVEKLKAETLKKEFGAEVFVYSVKDEKKYDPQGKSKKARPGMPGFWFE